MGNYTSSFANGAAVDAELTKVASSNLSATHKITRSATIVIAASDSSAASKAQADYVCDGTDDHVQMIAAFESLSTTGGKVVLSEGTYRVGTINLSYGDITLEGYGATIYQQDDTNAGVLHVKGDNISIMGISIDGNKDNNSYESHAILLSAYDGAITNIRVINCNIYNSSGDGVEMGYGDCSNVLVHGNTFRDNRENDVHVNGGTDVIISNNTAYDNEGTSIIVSSTVADMKNIQIIGNIVHGAYYGIAAGNRLDSGVHHRPENVIISGNIVTGCTMSGICAGEYVDGCLISGNTTNENTESGIYVKAGATGVDIRENQVCGNLCTTGNGAAVELFADGVVVDGNYICNNQKHGVYIRDSETHTIINNIIGNNSVAANNTYIGITAYINEDSENNMISDNRIYSDVANTYHNCISLSGSAGLFLNNVVANNMCYGASTSNFYVQAARKAADTIIKNNVGYVTENTGTATITKAETTVDVTHGLAAAPTRVLLSPTTATAGKQYYVSAKAATTFTITIDQAADADITFDWQAVV